jgi:hypothetical protein
MSNRTPGELAAALSEPFALEDIHFKPQAISGNRALAVAYVDARVIQDRLDAVLGVAGWQDDYECRPDGSVVCRLHVKLGEEWITKTDVGSPSDQPDSGDRVKSAFSDALKRAAVKYGVARYIYRLPPSWCDYDRQRKQLVSTPKLPEWALPGARAAHIADTNGAPPPAKGNSLPATGRELEERLAAYEGRLVEQGLCGPDELLRYVVDFLRDAGHGSDVDAWSEPAIRMAAEATKAFEQRARAKQARKEATLKRIASKAGA